MKQPTYILKSGTRVRTHMKLGPTVGMAVAVTALYRRQPDADGVIDGAVAGHGGDVYWVEHGAGAGHRAPYCFDEFELAALVACNRCGAECGHTAIDPVPVCSGCRAEKK